MEDMLFGLTSRQEDIVLLVRKGLQDKEVAEILNISRHTVKTHLKNIYAKLGVNNRTELSSLELWDGANSNNADVSGLWLSKFSYTAYRSGVDSFQEGVQFSLELLEKKECNDFFQYRGSNIAFCSNTKMIYRHEVDCRVQDNNIIGIWTNCDRSRNTGCFQLHLRNSSIIMDGKHLGNASDNSIQEGSWVWVRVGEKIDIKDNTQDVLSKRNMKIFQEIDLLYDETVRLGGVFSLEDILES